MTGVPSTSRNQYSTTWPWGRGRSARKWGLSQTSWRHRRTRQAPLPTRWYPSWPKALTGARRLLDRESIGGELVGQIRRRRPGRHRSGASHAGDHTWSTSTTKSDNIVLAKRLSRPRMAATVHPLPSMTKVPPSDDVLVSVGVDEVGAGRKWRVHLISGDRVAFGAGSATGVSSLVRKKTSPAIRITAAAAIPTRGPRRRFGRRPSVTSRLSVCISVLLSRGVVRTGTSTDLEHARVRDRVHPADHLSDLVVRHVAPSSAIGGEFSDLISRTGSRARESF